MKKKLLKILIYVSIFSMILTLCSGFATAVDPVSAATMANALAQAITAYGASQGVSMTFDVASTDGIGEGVHELWNDFKEDIQDNNVPTYDSLAVTMWADIYTKVGNNIGININDTEMPYIDAFWNWVLSGPAEMTKIDNEYYEWSKNQDQTVNPISVYNASFLGTYQGYNSISISMRISPYNVSAKGNNLIIFPIDNGSSIGCFAMNFSSVDDPGTVDKTLGNSTSVVTSTFRTYFNNDPCNIIPPQIFSIGTSDIRSTDFDTSNLITLRQFSDLYNSGANFSESDVSVRPYVGDIPRDVYIPDNEDVNYAPLPYIGGIDQLWDTSRFGDGTGTLTDAQKQAIADTVDNAITENPDKTIELADDSPLPAPPNEVYIPFLPLQLPNFNFSLSGIWHYVVTWVGSLGSWFTAMFNMWSCLPYAMVVPVYATLVVVIVLGVYRRFLS